MESGHPIHYVYLLVDKAHSRFKIGVSIDPIRRSKQLPQDFNLSMSLQAGFTEAEAYQMEGKLHELNHAFRVSWQEMGFRQHGSTEWFHIGCFALCRSILHDADALVPMRRIKPRESMPQDFAAKYTELLSDPKFLSLIREASARNMATQHSMDWH